MVLILFAHVMHCQTGKWIIPLSLDNSADFPVEVSFSNQNPPIVSNEMISEPFYSPTLISYGGFADNFDRKFCFHNQHIIQEEPFSNLATPLSNFDFKPICKVIPIPGQNNKFQVFYSVPVDPVFNEYKTSTFAFNNLEKIGNTYISQPYEVIQIDYTYYKTHHHVVLQSPLKLASGF